MKMNSVDRKANLKIIERNIKNKFKWDRLREKDEHGWKLQALPYVWSVMKRSCMESLVHIVLQQVTLLRDSTSY